MRSALFVDDDHTVAVTVECEANVGFSIDHQPLKRPRRGCSAAIVDVLAVGCVKKSEDLRAGMCEHGGRDAVRRAVRAIKSDPHAIQLRGHREKEVLVLPHQATCIADQADPALGRTRKHVLIGHPALDLFLRYVGELLRAVVEELDAVVRRRVMRRADDRPRDELTSFGEVREAGGRDVADKPHLHADRAQTRGERAFEHPPASSSVPADDDRVAAAPEDVPRRATEPERELRREVEIRHTANAIGTEQPGH